MKERYVFTVAGFGQMSCGTQHALVLIHHSRQSAVCYEKCVIMRGQFCTL